MEEPAEDLVLALQGENADDLSRLASLQKIEGLLDEAAGPDDFNDRKRRERGKQCAGGGQGPLPQV